MAKVLMTLRSPEMPTIEAIKQRYGLSAGDIDEQFGVVEIDDRAHEYTILVEPEAAQKISPDRDWSAQGPFSNPKIEPLGPPKE